MGFKHHRAPVSTNQGYFYIAYLFDVKLFECLCCAVHSILLHLLAHVSILDHRLAVAHFVRCVAVNGKNMTSIIAKFNG